MGFNVSSQHIFLLLPASILIGLAYAALFYYKEKKIDIERKKLKTLFYVLRTLSVAMVFFTLFSPIFSYINREIEQPIIVIAQDNSESITAEKSAYYKIDYAKKIKDLQSKLGAAYNLKSYSFGKDLEDSLKTTFTAKQTDINNALMSIEERYAGRNLGAIILATDGIFNKGASPLNSLSSTKTPIYTIGLGNPTVKKDVFINHISNNRIAYLKNVFPMEVVVQANQCNGNNTTVTISKNGKVLKSQALVIDANDFSKTLNFELEADQKGIQHYKIETSTIQGEHTKENNVSDVYIEVIDNKQNILIVSAAPHPDIASIKEALESTQLYSVSVQSINDFKENISKYNLIIFNQLPSILSQNQALIKEAQTKKIGVWYILGQQSNLNTLNSADLGFTFNGGRSQADIAQGILNNEFGLFNLENKDLENIKNFPPLTAPYGTIATKNTTNTLCYKKIGSVNTSQSLWLFTEYNNQKICVIAGEGLWKWKLANYERFQNHDIFNTLIHKSAQYIAVQKNKENFKVYSKSIFNTDEQIILDAELYNESLEPINTPEVSITIKNASNKSFNFVFSKLNNAYQLNVGTMNAGSYSYEANTLFNGKKYTATGQFVVQSNNIELINTTANHQLLKTMSQQTKGKFVVPNQIDDLYEFIKNNKNIKASSFLTTSYKEFIEFWWLLIPILFLLALEWFLRKRNGGY